MAPLSVSDYINLVYIWCTNNLIPRIIDGVSDDSSACFFHSINLNSSSSPPWLLKDKSLPAKVPFFHLPNCSLSLSLSLVIIDITTFCLFIRESLIQTVNFIVKPRWPGNPTSHWPSRTFRWLRRRRERSESKFSTLLSVTPMLTRGAARYPSFHFVSLFFLFWFDWCFLLLGMNLVGNVEKEMVFFGMYVSFCAARVNSMICLIAAWSFFFLSWIYLILILQDPEGLFPCILGHEAAGYNILIK